MPTPKPFRKRFALPLIVVASQLLCLAPAIWAKVQEDPKGKITPTLSKESPTGFAIPKDLNAALRELDHMLSPELRKQIKSGTQGDMSQYHFGLGMWMRNNWGLWKRLELAKWFNKKGVQHPDDMSGIVLDSYWKHLNGKPIELEKQVALYKEYWIKVKAAEKVEKARAEGAKKTIQKMIVGLQVTPDRPIELTFPTTPQFGLRTRYAAPFGDGAIVTVKKFSPETFHREPDYDVRSYSIDLTNHTVHPLATVEGDPVEDSVVIAGTAYLNCSSGRILEIRGSRRTWISWPDFHTKPNFPVRLGIERGTDGEPAHLLALGNGQVSRWTGDHWESIPCGNFDFPTCIVPPEKIGNRMVFRSEGRNEDDKELSWIELEGRKRFVRFVDHVGVVGSDGPRWETVWNYAVAKEGTWWMSAGSVITNQSLLNWTPKSGYHIALYNDTTHWTGDFFTHSSTTDGEKGNELAVTAIEPAANGDLLAIGPYGMFNLHGKSLRRIYHFRGGPKDWTPSTLVILNPDTILAGGHWGGLALITKGKGIVTLDERVGESVKF